MAPQCSALNVSDQLRCEDVATSINGLFCSFHSRQCQALYKGYKRRNVQLDELDKAEPHYLATSSVPLANQTFAGVDSEHILQEVYHHLSTKHALLDRVIRARKLHHSRFFSLELDYGHQHYLDVLSNQKFLVGRALERLERRTAEVLYKQQKWFKWVRQLEDDEETQRENEKKKIRREAALFRRHEKEVKRRRQELKVKEDVRRQEAALEEAVRKRTANGAEQGDGEEGEEWDPIDDALEDERGTYIALIKHFLLMVNTTVDESDGEARKQGSNDTFVDQMLGLPSGSGSVVESSPASKPLEKAKKARKTKNKGDTNEGAVERLPDMSAQDSTEQIRKRLKEGVKHSYAAGHHVAGTIDNPVELQEKTAPLPDEEIDQLLLDVAEIKQLLLCRLLLSHATLLPAALEATSVEDFLNKREIPDADIRDLCLKMENPGLQEIRDACADLGRGEEEDDGDANDAQKVNTYEDRDEMLQVDKEEHRVRKGLLPRRHPAFERALPESWVPARERRMETRRHVPQSLFKQSQGDVTNTFIDFGNLDAEGRFKSRRMRVKVCGKYIYNYPSENSVARRGWLQFCIIAKDSHLHDVIKLCRNWDEFWDLNILVNFRYFPAAHWLIWKGDQLRQQLLQLGFIPYFQYDKAMEMTTSRQTGSRRGPIRQAHASTEMRNFMCAHLNRNDPTSRRFLQYISAETSRVVTLVRDAKTGRILKTPPDKHLWLARRKSGLGRASRTDWEVRLEVGPTFFAKMEELREWHFGFNEYYDVYIWDLEPGEHPSNLYNTIQQTLVRAHRCCNMTDLYNPARSILETLTREKSTMRVRDIKPGEQVDSLWDDILRGRCTTLVLGKREVGGDPWDGCFYNRADAVEDTILFPEERSTGKFDSVYKAKNSAIDDFMKKGPDFDRFILDLDTDEEPGDMTSSDEEDDGLFEDQSVQRGSKPLLLEAAHQALIQHALSADPVLSPIKNGKQNPKYKCEEKDAGWIEEAGAEQLRGMLTDEQKQDLALLQSWRPPHEYGSDPEKDFMCFMDREKSKAFKRCWHRADMQPGAHERYTEQIELVGQIVRYETKQDPFRFVRDLRFVNVHPNKNRLVIRDVRDARAMMLLFFPKYTTSELKQTFKHSPLVNQESRARDPPVRRSYLSNPNRPKAFWQDWDTLTQKRNFAMETDYPQDWDVAIRPTIARLYKESIIGNAYMPITPGQAFAAKEPGRELDLYCDLRVVIEDVIFPPHVEEPPSTERLMRAARTFSDMYKDARFAILRLWSAPHFWPLMVGPERREINSFCDARRRPWEWNFCPKDFPYTERSMHHSSRLRIRQYQHLLGERVFVKRDLFLVMGENEEDLLKYATAATFAIIGEPWRLEIDLWRSFVNIDMGFVENLKAEWLD